MAEDGGDGPRSRPSKTIGAENRSSKALKDFGVEHGGRLQGDAASDLKPRASTSRTIEPTEAQADKNKSLGDFVRQITKAGDVRDIESCQESQARLAKVYGSSLKKGQEESGGGTGGYWTVPTVFEKTILMEQAEEAVILPGVTNVPLGARAVEWPSLDQYKAPSRGNSAMFGGITVSRKGEKNPRDRTQAVATKVKLEANDLTAYSEFSRDDQQDSDGVVESMLTKLIGGAIGFRRDWEHMWGSTGRARPRATSVATP